MEENKRSNGEPDALYAAIAMALYEASGIEHDEEHTILTIKKVSSNYSPWSSKIYTLREIPGKKTW